MKLLGYINLILAILLLLGIIFFVIEKSWLIFLSFLAGMNFFIFICYLLKGKEK
jgi:hypothetical protein